MRFRPLICLLVWGALWLVPNTAQLQPTPEAPSTTTPAVAPEPTPAVSASSVPARPLSPRAKAAAYDSAPSTVFVGFYVNSLRDVDAQRQTFQADLYYWIRYRRRGTELVDEELEELRFINGDIEVMELEDRKAIDDLNYVLYRVKGQFHFHADFRRYPFDHQKLPIRVQHGYLHADQLQIQADLKSYERSKFAAHKTALGEHVAFADMIVTDVTHQVKESVYHTDFGDKSDLHGTTKKSTYVMSIIAQREVWPFLIKIVIPLLIIQILAYLVFFVAADRIDVAVGLTVTSLLASIAFQISLADSLPDIGYLTTADRIFHLSYFLIMAAMGQMVYAYNLFAEQKIEAARRLDLIGRIIYPIVFFVGVGLICWLW